MTSSNRYPKKDTYNNTDKNKVLHIRAQLIPFYRHTLFCSLVLFCGLAVASFTAVSLYADYIRKLPLDLPDIPIASDIPKLKTVKIEGPITNEAMELYYTAITSPEKNYYLALKELHEKFPGSPEAKVTLEDFSRLDAPFKKIREANALKKQQAKEQRLQYEQAALNELEALLKIKRAPLKKLKMLEQLTAKYPDTQAATKAAGQIAILKVEIEKHKIRATAAKKSHQTKKPEKPIVKINKPIKPEPPKETNSFAYGEKELEVIKIFIQRYKKLLSEWNLADAAELSTSLAQSTKFPQLQNFGKNCREDVKLLESFDSVLRNYFNRKRGKEMQISLVRGSQITGTLRPVEGNRLTIIVNSRFPQHIDFPFGLNADELIKIYDNAHTPTDPQTELIKPLYFFALDNEVAARNFFSQISNDDKRKQFHEALLKYTYKE